MKPFTGLSDVCRACFTVVDSILRTYALIDWMSVLCLGVHPGLVWCGVAAGRRPQSVSNTWLAAGVSCLPAWTATSRHTLAQPLTVSVALSLTLTSERLPACLPAYGLFCVMSMDRERYAQDAMPVCVVGCAKYDVHSTYRLYVTPNQTINQGGGQAGWMYVCMGLCVCRAA